MIKPKGLRNIQNYLFLKQSQLKYRDNIIQPGHLVPFSALARYCGHFDWSIGNHSKYREPKISLDHATAYKRLKQKIPHKFLKLSQCGTERQLSSILNTCNKHSSLVLIIVIVSPSRYLSSKFNLTDRQRPSLARVVQEVHHCTLLVLIYFSPVQSEFLTWSFVN